MRQRAGDREVNRRQSEEGATFALEKGPLEGRSSNMKGKEKGILYGEND